MCQTTQLARYATAFGDATRTGQHAVSASARYSAKVCAVCGRTSLEPVQLLEGTQLAVRALVEVPAVVVWAALDVRMQQLLETEARDDRRDEDRDEVSLSLQLPLLC